MKVEVQTQISATITLADEDEIQSLKTVLEKFLSTPFLAQEFPVTFDHALNLSVQLERLT